jgi:hypothetical protein
MAFARSLPTQFDDHTWVAEGNNDTPLWRSRGVGSKLAPAVAYVALADGRTTLVWSTYDAVPAADAFSRRVRTGNAFSNETMLAINTALGFSVTEWQGTVAEIHDTLPAQRRRG